MPRRSLTTDLAAIDDLIARDDGVVTHAELSELGLALSTVTYRCRPEGPWQSLLPGLLLTSNGRPTSAQLLRAGIKYAGADAVVTGLSALDTYLGRPRKPQAVHVLVPHTRQVSSTRFLI